VTDTLPIRVPALSDERVTYFVGDSGARLTVHPEVAPILIGFATDFHESVETLDPAQCYGDPAGNGIHLNYKLHDREATYSTRQIMTIGRIMDKWSLGGRSLLWWGTAQQPPLRAYFRLDVSRPVWEQAVTLLQQPLPDGVRPFPVIPYAGPVGSRVLRLRMPRMCGEDVLFLHHALFVAGHKDAHDEPGGDRFGPNTDRLVRHFQVDRGLEPDGIVGPATWAAVLK
jgi:Putative peptidoglycan binding domain